MRTRGIHRKVASSAVSALWLLATSLTLLVSLLSGCTNDSPRDDAERLGTSASAVSAPTGATASTFSGFTSTNLELTVSPSACSSNVAQYFFDVANASNGSVPLSSITIKYWIYDTSGETVVPNVWYGGCVTSPNGTCVHPVSGVTATATQFSPSCGASPTQQANTEITVSNTDGTPLPAGDTWTNVQTAINLANHASFTPGSGTWFSQPCKSGGPYAANSTFAVYVNGGLVFTSTGIDAPACRSPQGTQPITTYTLPPPSPLVGPEPQNTLIDVNVGLPIPNLTALEAFVDQRSDPTNPMYRQWLTPSAFLAQFAPSTGDYNTLMGWANGLGLQVIAYPSNLSVDVVGTASQIERAFFVNLVQAERRDGSVFYEPDRQPSIQLPVTTTLTVVGMAGLDSYATPLPKNESTAPTGTFASLDLRQDYLDIATPGSPCAALTGAGQTIGVFATADFLDSDITSYENQLTPKLTGVPTVLRYPSGTPPVSVGGETAQDIETAISIAPGAQVVAFESGSCDTVLNNMIAYPMTSGNSLNQVTNSYYCGPTSSSQGLLATLAGLGTSFFEATSDFGAWQPAATACTTVQLTQACQNGNQVELVAGGGPSCQSLTGLPKPPENSPFDSGGPANTDFVSLGYLTLVGGTVLIPDNATGYTPGGEQGWPGSGGGVFSPGAGFAGISIPAYQLGPNQLGPNSNNPVVSTKWRNSPDVSIVSTNHFSVIGGVAGGFGGTSSAAPSWAGFAAVMNEYAATAGAKPFGFLNTALYQIGANPTRYGAAFNDIDDSDSSDGVTTTNACGVGYTAVTGYDLVTGWGTPTCGLVTDITDFSCTTAMPTLPAFTGLFAVDTGVVPDEAIGATYGSAGCPNQFLIQIDPTGSQPLFITGLWSVTLAVPTCTGLSATVFVFGLPPNSSTWQVWDEAVYQSENNGGTQCQPVPVSHTNAASNGSDATLVPAGTFSQIRVAVEATQTLSGSTQKVPVTVFTEN